jgi:hypothetical protein
MENETSVEQSQGFKDKEWFKYLTSIWRGVVQFF